ncbi:hypothetical protein GCM10027267_22230 [Paramicrobacterium agarici]
MPEARQRTVHGLPLRVEKLGLRHDINNKSGHVGLRNENAWHKDASSLLCRGLSKLSTDAGEIPHTIGSVHETFRADSRLHGTALGAARAARGARCLRHGARQRRAVGP